MADPFAGLSPLDALRLRQELAGRYTTPEEQQANLAQTGQDAMSAMPLIGNAMAAKDAYGYGQDAVNQASQGQYGQALQSGGMSGLSALQAMLGLPFGRAAGQAAQGATGMARSGPPTPWAGWRQGNDEIADEWAAKMAQGRQEQPFNAKPYYDEMAGANQAARADPEAIAAETAQRMQERIMMQRYLVMNDPNRRQMSSYGRRMRDETE